MRGGKKGKKTERNRRRKKVEQRNRKDGETNVQKRAPEVSTICVYTRGFRGHLTYISSLPPASLCLRPLLFSLSRASISLRSRFFFPLLSAFRLRLSAHRVFTPRLPLYHPAIISHTCHSLSLSSPPQSTPPQPILLPTRIIALPCLCRCTHHTRAAFYKIYVCRRAGDVAAGYLFFQ